MALFSPPETPVLAGFPAVISRANFAPLPVLGSDRLGLHIGVPKATDRQAAAPWGPAPSETGRDPQVLEELLRRLDAADQKVIPRLTSMKTPGISWSRRKTQRCRVICWRSRIRSTTVANERPGSRPPRAAGQDPCRPHETCFFPSLFAPTAKSGSNSSQQADFCVPIPLQWSEGA